VQTLLALLLVVVCSCFTSVCLLLLLLLQAPGAWAHAPLQERLAELQVPVTFVYAAAAAAGTRCLGACPSARTSSSAQVALLLLLLLQAPGAWAHAPLQERLAELKVPVTFIYGEHDWMQPAAGKALADKLDQIRPRKVGRGLANGGWGCRA
jgi:pimeloyl-ACP methyl ester carboxylesterase